MQKVINIIAYLLLAVLALVTLFPFVYMILAGLMTYTEVTSIPPTIIPEKLQWANSTDVFSNTHTTRYFFDTFFVSAIATLFTVVTSVLAGFALSSLQFKHKGLVIGLLVSLLMVPYESIIFTNYHTIAQMGLLNSYTALIIPFLTSIF